MEKIAVGRPAADEYAEYYAGYVSLVPEEDILSLLEQQRTEIVDLLGAIPKEREQYRYANGKWSIREIAGHLADAERIFGYRALAFGRADANELPGFDENAYVARSAYNNHALGETVALFSALRSANIITLHQLRAEEWMLRGVASKHEISVRAIAYVIAGHVRHHRNVLKERYGI